MSTDYVDTGGPGVMLRKWKAVGTSYDSEAEAWAAAVASPPGGSPYYVYDDEWCSYTWRHYSTYGAGLIRLRGGFMYPTKRAVFRGDFWTWPNGTNFNIASSGRNKFRIQVDLDYFDLQTVTINEHVCTTAAATAAECQRAIRALGDDFSDVEVKVGAYNSFYVYSPTEGPDSDVIVAPVYKEGVFPLQETSDSVGGLLGWAGEDAGPYSGGCFGGRHHWPIISIEARWSVSGDGVCGSNGVPVNCYYTADFTPTDGADWGDRIITPFCPTITPPAVAKDETKTGITPAYTTSWKRLWDPVYLSDPPSYSWVPGMTKFLNEETFPTTPRTADTHWDMMASVGARVTHLVRPYGGRGLTPMNGPGQARSGVKGPGVRG